MMDDYKRTAVLASQLADFPEPLARYRVLLRHMGGECTKRIHDNHARSNFFDQANQPFRVTGFRHQQEIARGLTQVQKAYKRVPHHLAIKHGILQIEVENAALMRLHAQKWNSCCDR